MKHSALLNKDFKDNLILYKAERDEINKLQYHKVRDAITANKTVSVMERALRAKAAHDAVILAFGGK